MRRIDESGHIDNLFVRAIAGIGQIATRIGAKWPNNVQEEICTVIEGAGLTVISGDDDDDYTQLRQAILAMLSEHVTPVGAVLSLAGNAAACPAGWLVLDGAAKSRVTYSALWAYAQASGILAADGADKVAHPGKFGLGDGATTFELPKIEDYLSGLKAGRTPGTFQLDQMQQITGSIGNVIKVNTGGYTFTGAFSKGADQDASDPGSDNGIFRMSIANFDSADSPGARTGATTLPRNTSYPFIIKY